MEPELEDLPSEILINIFSNLNLIDLDTVGQVCTKFKECCKVVIDLYYEHIIFSAVDDPFIESFFLASSDLKIKTVRKPVTGDEIAR